MPDDAVYQEQFVCFTVMDFAKCADDNPDLLFSTLVNTRPDVYDKLEAYMANKKIQEFLLNQEEVL